MSQDSRIDAYILKAESFAKPILKHIRSLVHEACPETQETMKWSFPHFLYEGKILCFMSSFKQHCAFGFWKGPLMPELKDTITKKGDQAMGQFGKIASLSDLPSDRILKNLIVKAMRLTEEGRSLPAKKPKKPVPLVIPDYFSEAISKSKKALKTFEGFSYSHKKEYVEWITEAKTEATRVKRMKTAIEWLKEGKDRNWKYH